MFYERTCWSSLLTVMIIFTSCRFFLVSEGSRPTLVLSHIACYNGTFKVTNFKPNKPVLTICSDEKHHDVCLVDASGAPSGCGIGASSPQCGNSIPTKFICKPELGCCCKPDKDNINMCNTPDLVADFCNDPASGFTDENICPKERCLDKHGKEIVCGYPFYKCKVSAESGEPEGCSDPQEDRECWDLPLFRQPLMCRKGSGCCCDADETGECNSKKAVAIYCAKQNPPLDDKVICPPPVFSGPRVCLEANGTTVTCLNSGETHCKLDTNGVPQGCVHPVLDLDSCDFPASTDRSLKCTPKGCCCKAEKSPCNSWDEFCAKNPTPAACMDKRICMTLLSGQESLEMCAFPMAVCKIDESGNPAGCVVRKNSDCDNVTATGLLCRAGKGCCCNAGFDKNPCNVKSQLDLLCSQQNLKDEILCPSNESLVTTTTKRTTKSPIRTGSGNGGASSTPHLYIFPTFHFFVLSYY